MSNDRPASVVKPARAKINLSLHVTGKRADGYHLLDSFVVFADIGDEISARPASVTGLEISGPFAAGLGTGDDNLIISAHNKLSKAQKKQIPATAFSLQKNLPVSSGIGGGSADAAAALAALIDLWKLDISNSELEELALELGADVPVCLQSKSCRMSGIGENLEPVENFPKMPAVLVNPGVAVSTAKIFKTLGLQPGDKAGTGLDQLPDNKWLNWLKTSRNDLQNAAIKQAPQIKQVLDILTNSNGCDLARMSGSGATCFGLFASTRQAQTAAKTIATNHQNWWVKNTVFG